MNKQKIFDKVATHLLMQNAKAVGSNGLCLYITAEGLRCGIGCLIPKGHKALNSGASAEALFEDHSDLAKLYSIDVSAESTDLNFIMSLQSVHDEIEVKGWKTGLRSFAIAESLNDSVLENF